MNTGHDVRLVLDDATAAYVNISGGPLAYQYRVHELSIHFGRDDARGSEHSIERQHFPAEVFTDFFRPFVDLWRTNAYLFVIQN